jgi:phosphonoacetate hydrolase
MNTPVNINGIHYRWPVRPVVVVCIDGGDPSYLRRFLADGSIPNIERFVQEGFAAVADGSMPSFTCPNNMSIITGTPTSRHGISGNYYLDTQTWEPVGFHHCQGQTQTSTWQGPGCPQGTCLVFVRICRPLHFGRKRH